MSFEDTGKHDPVSRVTLFVDDDNYYTAGDDTGKEITASCPSATQEMADALLEKLRGYQHQSFNADAANIDPAAELGDGVSVGGIYAGIAQIRDDGYGYSDISAPDAPEVEDEYPYISPIQQEIKRQSTEIYSLISKTSEEILLEVGRLDGELGQTLRVAADGVTITNAKGDTLTIDGGQIDASKIKTEDLDASKINAADLVLTGTITWKDLSSDTQSSITDAQSTADSAKSTADSAKSTADSASAAASGTQVNLALLANGQYQGGTFISGTSIYSPELVGDSIKLTNGSSYTVGEIALKSSSTAAFDITSYLSLRLQSAAGWNAYLGNGYSSGSGRLAAVQCNSTGVMNLYADGGLCVSSASFGSSLPSSGSPGQIFFLLG